MERAVVQITLFGLLLALATALPDKDNWDIYSFHINSTVTSRYATTIITSRVANRMDESKEIEFLVRIPKNAFISKFRMFIDGQVYDGTVNAKEKAQQQYTEAVSRGQSAGIVSSVGRTLEEFKTSVTIAPHKKVTFELTYEELLKRRLGKYELQIHARPMQPVKDFKVDVHIHEKAGISFVDVKGGLSTKALANAITKTHADTQAWVYFYPTEDQQLTCDSCGKEGMNGDLVVVYDVNRNSTFGDLKKSDGYFVHHFAPSSLSRIPKNVVFIIDRSGSMHGKKMQQTRIALIHILNDLAEDDHFGLITFDGAISHWKRELVQASKENLDSAKTFARGIQDRGATDINEAVLEGARMLNAHPREGSASILILLTDGDPTSGVTNLEMIESNVRKAIADKFPLYCLGFGFDVNFDFLKTMSLQNNGVARRIYEDSDADLQLKGFYEEVATPLLTDVTMIYTGGSNLTKTNFSQYYNGSEIVVAGQITDNDIETFSPQVVAISGTRRLTFSESSTTVQSPEAVSDGIIKRVWAYLTVKQLLEKELLLDDTEKEKVKKEALELSLKYSFVTPLTSMVVTKPPGESTDVLNKPKEGQPQPLGPPGGFGQQGAAGSPSSGHFRFHSLPPFRVHGLPPHPPMSRDVTSHGQPLLVTHVVEVEPTLTKVSSVIEDEPTVTKVSRVLSDEVLSSHHKVTPSFQSIPSVSSRKIQSRKGSKRRKISHKAPSRDYALPGSLPDFDLDDALVGAMVPDFGLPPAATTGTAPLSHRFLLKSEIQSVPLCFDVTGNICLKLLHYPSREVTVNGELDSVTNGGFSKFTIHFKAGQFLEVTTNEVNLQDGQTRRSIMGEDPVSVGSLTVIRRNKEVDVAVGDIRIIILMHEKDGAEFLWPVLRQKPSDDTNTRGIFGLNPVVYEEVQQTPSTILRMKDQEIDVTRSRADDHSTTPSTTLDCWLMSAEAALQRPLDDVKC